MSGPIDVRPGVVVPPDAIVMHASRASGPGGQNVNKVSSKVELRVDLDRIRGLDAPARERLRRLVVGALDAAGLWRVTSQRTREQRLNIEDARDKVRDAVLRALVRPRTRRSTKPTRGSVERRIGEKKKRAEVKANRRDGGR